MGVFPFPFPCLVTGQLGLGFGLTRAFKLAVVRPPPRASEYSCFLSTLGKHVHSDVMRGDSDAIVLSLLRHPFWLRGVAYAARAGV